MRKGNRLSPEERTLLQEFRHLPEQDREALLELIREMREEGEEKRTHHHWCPARLES